MARGSAKGSYWLPKYQRDSTKSVEREAADEVEETELSLDLTRVMEDDFDPCESCGHGD